MAKKAKFLKTKDKFKPKKATSAFFFYMKNRREPLKQEQPQITHTEIISVMSSEWRNMNDNDKAPYNKLAEKDRERAEKEKQEYRNDA